VTILQNTDDLDHNLTDLNIIKGEKLVSFETKIIGSLKQFSITFKSSNGLKTSKTHNILLKAHSVNFKKQVNDLDNVFTSVQAKDLIGKELLEYEDWHVENLADTGNLTGPQYNLTLTFENGYSIEIWDYQ
jgi:hypothetical protein